ncbi:MAG: hypothetical protein HY666_01710 [Chloroflexi bacterium]|nr:hypothetical protein [Chloroflexota bacterium]
MELSPWVFPTLFWIGIALLSFVEGLLIFLTISPRDRDQSTQESATRASTELLWLMIPLALLLTLVIVSLKTIR